MKTEKNKHNIDFNEQILVLCEQLNEKIELDDHAPKDSNIFISSLYLEEEKIKKYFCMEREFANIYFMSIWEYDISKETCIRIKVYDIPNKYKMPAEIIEFFVLMLNEMKGKHKCLSIKHGNQNL